ncbi:hypothetical protein PHLGIDRAFT_125773 [Phlebiopsis gigantea 11061_1 CR5-6]|uniref:VHS domain-containing protein n=1 Tax=Phlebiopsis gigantea (strain 11061_1 CR5-6) TaxID=745531 RepID=A0A0C3SBK8_PHLG1|nr:hypothetical protein PHLGIDRAFT_125773 [Phlebiopsis gigantea 11061_1 CR5-6]
MSAMSLAKQAYSAFNREKPHSSITEWVEILTAQGTGDEAYDGIPELVDSINIQATGPAEASRALRKKLKHGDTHQQYRALVILKALVENGGHRFQTSFADSQLTDAIKMLASDSGTDPKVKKKLIAVLASLNAQFKDDPSMSFVANLYNSVKPPRPAARAPAAAVRASVDRPSLDDDTFQIDAAGLGMGNSYEDRRRKEEQERKEEKRRAKEAKEAEKRKKLEEEQKKKAQGKVKRKAFNFEEEKPQILTTIANASTAANNLVNAITLVNTEHDSLVTNERVQECLQKAKLSRKQIVRYVQLVENEDMIGTLIETNDRIIAALETYDTLSKPSVSEKDVEDVQTNLAAVKIQDSELGKLQEKQRAAVKRSLGRASGQSGKARADDADEFYTSGRQSGAVHPDLQDLSFGSLGAERNNLPPPIRPARRDYDEDDDPVYHRGSLSDFSDYESSDEEAHKRASASASAAKHQYPHSHQQGSRSSDDEVDVRQNTHEHLVDEEDPFADPFVDQ